MQSGIFPPIQNVLIQEKNFKERINVYTISCFSYEGLTKTDATQ